MDTVTLSQEDFKAAQELSKLGEQIARGRATLASLTEETELYVKKRETVVADKIRDLLKDSEDVLREVSKNHAILTSYTTQAREFAESIIAMWHDFKALREEFDAAQEAALENIAEEKKHITHAHKTLKAHRALLDADMEEIKKAKKALSDERRRIKDDRETLQRGFNELKRKKL